MLYEISWHKQGCDYCDDWFEIESSYQEAVKEYDSLKPKLIAEIEESPITVFLKQFEPLDRYGNTLDSASLTEEFYNTWYLDGKRQLIASKESS